LRIALGDDEAVAAYVSAGLKTRIIPPFTAMGVVDKNGILCGGIIFNSFNGFNIEASVYGPACASRGVLRAVMAYVFVQLKCLRLTCKTRRSNRSVIQQLIRLGFTHEGMQRNYFGPQRGDDAILYALFPQAAARWIKEH
jgi:hypothetical protein